MSFFPKCWIVTGVKHHGIQIKMTKEGRKATNVVEQERHAFVGRELAKAYEQELLDKGYTVYFRRWRPGKKKRH